MDVEAVERRLQTEYLGKKIVKLPEDNPTEIVCEVEPASEHPDYSVAVAIIDESASHIHQRSTETYEVLEGKANLIVEGRSVEMKPGQTYSIKPGTLHWATADSAWVKITSHPGWTEDDHLVRVYPARSLSAKVRTLIDGGWDFRRGMDEPSVLISPDDDSQLTVKEDGTLYDHHA